MCNCNSVKNGKSAANYENRQSVWEAQPFGIAEYTANNIDVFIIDLFNKIK